MPAEKTVPLSLRVSPEFKALLGSAAATDHRSITNLLESLVYAHCEQRGIKAPLLRSLPTVNKNGERNE